ncbi:MAG TPA: DUF1579 family protein [Pyrinomonadaceae bacterium]|jgi:hypothetical protein|nr:DUF1579 family protein [Pyrinomonadaceae bacterium]
MYNKLFSVRLIVLAIVLSASSAFSQNTAPCYHQEFEALRFLEGNWEVESNTKSGDGKWEKTKAVSQIGPELSGCLLKEQFSGSRSGRPFNILALIAYNGTSKKMQRAWSDSEHGLLILYDGEKTGDQMILTTAIDLDGKKVLLRIAYTEIKNDSFKVESGRSHDEGKTWITTSTLLYKRKRSQ